jgi:hypothetical protein
MLLNTCPAQQDGPRRITRHAGKRARAHYKPAAPRGSRGLLAHLGSPISLSAPRRAATARAGKVARGGKETRTLLVLQARPNNSS